MGHGVPPGPVNELRTPSLIDEGTLARTPSPPPSPIGLDAKGGAAKGDQASMADRIVSYARTRLGDRVGDGECFTLVDRALRRAEAKSARDFGDVTPDADYVWGTAVTLSELQPGDIIQFRDYECDIHTESPTEVSDFTHERPHHTAIVERVGENGAVTVLEQNAPEGARLARNRLFFTSRTSRSGGETTRITVRGTFWFYRPEAR